LIGDSGGRATSAAARVLTQEKPEKEQKDRGQVGIPYSRASAVPLAIDPALFYLWNSYCLGRNSLHMINSITYLSG
jgi:hypothetical protein